MNAGTLGLSPAVVSMLEWLQWVFFAYFIVLNLTYLALNYISMFGIVRHMHEHGTKFMWNNFRAYQPPVSIIVPAFNEERTIVSSIRSLLRLGYPNFEIVVVNDGSTDSTLAEVVRAFSLVEFPEAYRKRLKTKDVHRLYASPAYPNVRLVDKVNGGKADALNAGINCARYPLFCVVDADCILQQDSLARVVQPFLEDSTTVAAGGVIRVVNGCQVKDGFLTNVDLPRKLLPLVQTVEYLRAFLFGRLGWSPMNALLIISGAFGVFYKERVIAAGGYHGDTVGEDMELVVRLHRQLREEKRPYRITFVPDPICWTEAPEDLGSLCRQRMRWQQGLAESLFPHWRLMFRRSGGTVGWLAYPFMLFFECIGPFIEVLGYVSMIVLGLAGVLSPEAFFVFLFASVGLGVLLSANALVLEELSFHLYPRPGQQFKLFLVAIFENFGYRQLTSVWRLMGLVRWLVRLRGRSRWGRVRRNATWQQEGSPDDNDVPAPHVAGISSGAWPPRQHPDGAG
ncbi:glycosyltransferase family 2 protein [Lysobacter niabensis]|uniref:glycosyltransferase family 2 protein n=1 Tax=Agrilutibacter niabensis TaxID=380628 RepID=UPI00360A3F4E